MRIAGPRLRITAAGAHHVLHHDTWATFLVQLSGRKRVTLVAPSQVSLLHSYEDSHLLARRARVDLDNIDSEQFPDALAVRPVRVVMRPGDVLVFPPKAAHSTLSLTDSISVSARLQQLVRAA